MPPDHIGPFLSDIRSVQADVRGGNISNSQKFTLYTQWTALCTYLYLYHLLEEPNLPSVDIPWVYSHRVHHGHYSYQSNRIKTDLVATAWRAIAKTHLLEGRRNPIKSARFPREGPRQAPHQYDLELLLTISADKTRKDHPNGPQHGCCRGKQPLLPLCTVISRPRPDPPLLLPAIM